MRRFKIFCIVSSMLLLSGCGAKETVLVHSDFEEVSFRRVETLPEGFALSECTVLEDEVNIGAFCVYGEDLVYEVNYKDFLTDQTGLKGDIPFEDKYNTQLRRRNMTTGEDELLYKYDAQGGVDITDIVYNEKYLVWETMEDTWKVHLLHLEQDSPVEAIVYGVQNVGDLNEVILRLKEDELFWYNKNGSEDNCISLYSYNISNKEICSHKSNLDLVSPYTKPAMVGEICTTFARKPEGENEIYITEMNKNKEKILNVNMPVCNPISNDKYCIWTSGYGGESSNIYVHDLDANTSSVISLGEAGCFSYALLGEYIIINQRGSSKYGEEGLYCFRPDNGEYHRFEGLEEKTILHTFQGVEGNVYFQVGDETSDFRVVNISSKQEASMILSAELDVELAKEYVMEEIKSLMDSDVTHCVWTEDTQIVLTVPLYDCDDVCFGYVFKLSTNGEETGYIQVNYLNEEIFTYCRSYQGIPAYEGLAKEGLARKFEEQTEKLYFFGNMNYSYKTEDKKFASINGRAEVEEEEAKKYFQEFMTSVVQNRMKRAQE